MNYENDNKRRVNITIIWFLIDENTGIKEKMGDLTIKEAEYQKIEDLFLERKTQCSLGVAM